MEGIKVILWLWRVDENISDGDGVIGVNSFLEIGKDFSWLFRRCLPRTSDFILSGNASLCVGRGYSLLP